MKAMAPQRAVAIASNVAFIAYGILHALYGYPALSCAGMHIDQS